MVTVQQFINGHGIVFQSFLYGFLLAYAYNIGTNVLRLFQIYKGISRLKRFIIIRRGDPFYKFRKQMLLSYFPVISKYLGTYSKITYSDDHFQLHQKAKTMYTDLLSERDFQKYELRDSFNPILGIKTFITFPITILSWFGISLRSKNSLLVGIIGWTIAYFLGMFQPEIKQLFIMLFKYLVETQKP